MSRAILLEYQAQTEATATAAAVTAGSAVAAPHGSDEHAVHRAIRRSPRQLEHGRTWRSPGRRSSGTGWSNEWSARCRQHGEPPDPPPACWQQTRHADAACQRTASRQAG
jgi:hypothetical protein